MIVDVVLMRAEGVRRNPDLLLAEKPLRGTLVVYSTEDTHIALGQQPTRYQVAKLLYPDEDDPVQMLALFHSRLTSLRGDEFVLAGIDENGVKQSWWCRPTK